MAQTVITAFELFMKEHVNLDGDKTKTARSSRDWLVQKINGFDDFFPLYNGYNIHFGSFARRTKKKPLDDIDIMICLSANGITWGEIANTVYLTVPEPSNDYKNYKHTDSNFLNSKKVINKFISSLGNVEQYGKADINRNQEAATLKLKSYDWNFDIVPCFITNENSNGVSYYIIPDGNGHWKKTDPRIDKYRVTTTNQNHNGNILAAIRIMKYWNRRPTMPSMGSYLLENMILDFYEKTGNTCSSFIYIEVINLLSYVASAIFSQVQDPKGIQGNLNTLSFDEQFKIYSRAKLDSEKALDALKLKVNEDHKASINKWREIFGPNFPEYYEN